MNDFTVRQYGLDSSGRPIFMTAYMRRWWDGICAELGFEPTIVQGAWMVRAGGGAAESAGYHDGGGCLDLRTWDLSATQQQAVIHATRWGGAGSWIRGSKQGMDPHIHLVLGSDDDLSTGAAWQWLNYLHGGDGLSGDGRDYHDRPRPLVTEPPASLMEDDMAFTDWPQKDQDELVNRIAAAVTKRLLDTDLTPKQDEPKSSVRAALNAILQTNKRAKP